MHIGVDAFRVLHWANGSAFLRRRQNNTKPMGITFPLNLIRLQWVYYRKFKFIHEDMYTIELNYTLLWGFEEGRKTLSGLINVMQSSGVQTFDCCFFVFSTCRLQFYLIMNTTMNFIPQMCAFTFQDKLKSDVDK